MAFFSEVSGAPAGAVSRLVSDIAEGYRTLSTLMARYREYARAEAELRSLSDRELNDIGLSRADIREKVWADFDRA